MTRCSVEFVSHDFDQKACARQRHKTLALLLVGLNTKASVSKCLVNFFK